MRAGITLTPRAPVGYESAEERVPTGSGSVPTIVGMPTSLHTGSIPTAVGVDVTCLQPSRRESGLEGHRSTRPFFHPRILQPDSGSGGRSNDDRRRSRAGSISLSTQTPNDMTPSDMNDDSHTNNSRSVSRRRFLQSLGITGVALGAGGSLLVACDSGGSNEDDEDDDIARTFTVTVESVDDSYPYSDQNNIGVAFAIGGEAGRVITLERGKTYEFELGDGVDPNHPFYIGTTAEGQGGDEFRDDPAKATTGTVTVTVPSSAPDSLFYVCDNHVYMGGEMEITDSSSSGDDGNY